MTDHHEIIKISKEWPSQTLPECSADLDVPQHFSETFQACTLAGTQSKQNKGIITYSIAKRKNAAKDCHGYRDEMQWLFTCYAHSVLLKKYWVWVPCLCFWWSISDWGEEKQKACWELASKHQVYSAGQCSKTFQLRSCPIYPQRRMAKEHMGLDVFLRWKKMLDTELWTIYCGGVKVKYNISPIFHAYYISSEGTMDRGGPACSSLLFTESLGLQSEWHLPIGPPFSIACLTLEPKQWAQATSKSP